MFANKRDIDWCGKVRFRFTDAETARCNPVTRPCPFLVPQRDKLEDIAIPPKSRKSIVAKPDAGGWLREVRVTAKVMTAISRGQLEVSGVLFANEYAKNESHHCRVALDTSHCTDRIVILDRTVMAREETFELRVRNLGYDGQVGPRQFLLIVDDGS
jgi:hypothetical protein